MTTPTEAVLLRVYLGESKRCGPRPLYEAVVLKARADRIDRLGDGTLVVLDYKTGVVPTAAALLDGTAPLVPLEAALHTAKILRLSGDLPVVVEIVDSDERIDAFLPELQAVMGDNSGLITLEKVRVIRVPPPSP